LFIPWYVTQNELEKLFIDQGHEIKKVTNGYYTVECISLNGLSHRLGFHFQPNKSNELKILEFFRNSYPNLYESFNEFQVHFEKSFGFPTKTYPKNSEGFPSYEWEMEGIRVKFTIRHYVFDRFGLEEHMHIERKIK
jgi:hypothetical protein